MVRLCSKNQTVWTRGEKDLATRGVNSGCAPTAAGPPPTGPSALQWSTPSHRGVQGDDAHGVVRQPHSQEPGALLSRRNVSQAHANHVSRHLLPLRVLVQLARLRTDRQESCSQTLVPFVRNPWQHLITDSHRVHFKVDQLSSCEGDDHLSLIDSTADDGLLARSLPLIHTLVCTDVTDPVWVDLHGHTGTRGDLTVLWALG